MIACYICGQPLEPFEITSGGRTWTHEPHCWHPETEEVHGEEMSLKTAIHLAEDRLAEYKDLVFGQQYVVDRLKGMEE